MHAESNQPEEAGFDPQIEQLLDEMDRRSEEIGEGVRYGRKSQRYRYRRPRTKLDVRGGGGGDLQTEVYTRNLSAGGLGALHAGELPREASAMVELRRASGETDRLAATIVYCQKASGKWWSVGLRFEQPAQLERYLKMDEPPG